jgi:HTH-type transcriptional repressor of NAD biosynthesis genes
METDIKLVCFYGPESTGKSVMAERLAKAYHTQFVPEVAKEIITSNDFTVEDIIRIGHAQTERIIEKSKTANRILFCDTDVITTQIYSRHYLKTVPEILFTLEHQIRFDKYFLFYPDVPWVADGLRDLGNRRDEMMQIFEEELTKRNLSFIPVKGDWKEREAIIEKEINQLLIN